MDASGCAESAEGFIQSTQKRSHLQGGYECIFVEEPPKHLQTDCSVCLSVLKEPHLIDCDCGSSFCRTCIQPIKSEGKPCPLCNGPFTTSIPDRRLNRTLNSLQVYCSYKELGCEWVGELGKLTQHISLDLPGSTSNAVLAEDICRFVPIDCTHCQEKFQRRFIEEHKTVLCPKRPFCCDICSDFKSTFEEVSISHKPVCPSRLVPCSNKCGVNAKFKDLSKHLTDECPLEIIECSFSFAGCEAKLPRKDMPAHISDSLAVHMSLQAVSHHKQIGKLEPRVQDLEIENTRLKDEVRMLKAHVEVAPVQLELNEYTSKKENGAVWTSRPFYTHLQGYKMCLLVYVNGDGDDDSVAAHVSIYTEVMCGEFDHQLNWPFQGSLVVTLIDHEGEEHWIKDNVFIYDEETPKECSSRVINGDENEGWGTTAFIAHEDLHPKYYKNDSLVFKVDVSYVKLTI